jgi:hypothetical protein
LVKHAGGDIQDNSFAQSSRMIDWAIVLRTGETARFVYQEERRWIQGRVLIDIDNIFNEVIIQSKFSRYKRQRILSVCQVKDFSRAVGEE